MASAGLLSPSRGLGVRNVDGACVRVSTPVRRLLSPVRPPAPAAARAGAERLVARDLTGSFVSTDLPSRARLRVLAAASKRSRIGELRPRIGVAGGVNAKRARKRSAVAGLARSPAAVVSHVLADVSPVLAVNSTSKLYTPAELLFAPSSPISTAAGKARAGSESGGGASGGGEDVHATADAYAGISAMLTIFAMVMCCATLGVAAGALIEHSGLNLSLLYGGISESAATACAAAGAYVAAAYAYARNSIARRADLFCEVLCPYSDSWQEMDRVHATMWRQCGC